MNNIRTSRLVFILLVAGLASSGCSTMTGKTTTETTSTAAQDAALAEKDSEISSLQSTINRLKQSLAADESQKTATMAGVAGTELLPPNAKPGECYARVFIPPQYKTEDIRVVRREASSRIETTPPRFEWVDEQVLSRGASERLEVVPATYEWVEEQVLVRPASSRLETVPAVYDNISEKILDKPAHTMWKKGTGPITRVDEATGEIMCLVEVPATYKTVTKRVQVKPATTREVEIPAEYKTVKRRVMKTPPTTRKVEIPAEYTTMRVRKLAEPAKSNVIPIPEVADTVTKRIMVADGRIEWRPILCKTNTTPDIVARIQTALDKAGHNPGPIDGVIGAQTMAAVTSYQKSKGLATGGITINTLKSLGVMYQ
jgi:hypothetical protein